MHKDKDIALREEGKEEDLSSSLYFLFLLLSSALLKFVTLYKTREYGIFFSSESWMRMERKEEVTIL